MSIAGGLLIGLFLPLFPLSMVLNRLSSLLAHPLLRAGLLLIWPQVGLLIFIKLGEEPPAWIAPWALLTALLYGFRSLTERDVHCWISILATSQWSLLWIPLLAPTTNLHLIAFALAFSIPLALTAYLAGGLDQRFGGAYTHLYGGLASTIPRYSTMLTLCVLALMATPLFPGFFVMVKLLLLSNPFTLIVTLITWYVWNWAGIRLLQGLIIGRNNYRHQIADSHRGLTSAYVLTFFALTAAGLYASGGII